MHGFANDHRVNWVEPGVVDALVAGGRKVIVYDARGHGESDKPHTPEAYEHDAMPNDARALLDHLRIEVVDVVAYSMGSGMAARWVPDEPRVRSLVLGGVGESSLRGRLSPDERAALAEALEAADPATIPKGRPRTFRRLADYSGADRLALAAMQRSATPEGSTRFEAISVPTLVIAGDQDELAGSPAVLADRIPGATVRVVEGTHFSAVADPAFAAAIVDFVTGVATT